MLCSYFIVAYLLIEVLTSQMLTSATPYLAAIVNLFLRYRQTVNFCPQYMSINQSINQSVSQSVNQSISHWICIRRHKIIVSYDDDTEASGTHGQPKTR